MPKPELESAERFAMRLVQGVEPRWTTVANVKCMAPAIEARDAAVALRVLGEVRASAFALDDTGLQFTWREALQKAIAVVAAKYTERDGRKEK